MKHKYRAKPTIVDGIRFASKKEAKRYGELKLLESAGKISNLQLQVIFAWECFLTVDGFESAKVRETEKYIADFVYTENQKEVVEDVKGFQTPVYKRKRKIMRKLFGIEIRET